MDRVLGYRICAFHRHHHGGVHVHDEGDAVVGRLPDLSMGRAEALLRRYARRHGRFSIERLREEVRLWRSG